ncbi:MAG: serine carboxypeptidase S28-domain-containing protein [Monoraphidium minutum]|nr:MAG: serine carboxypeptidase S28-domain-containing protein [Monoraphidium minutum]
MSKPRWRLTFRRRWRSQTQLTTTAHSSVTGERGADGRVSRSGGGCVFASGCALACACACAVPSVWLLFDLLPDAQNTPCPTSAQLQAHNNAPRKPTHSLCDNIRFKFGNAAIESVTLNKTNPERWPGDPDCQPGVFTQKLDHFDPSETRTFEQSYYVCKQFWPADAAVQKAEGKILFYQGAETPLGGEPQQPMIWEGAARQRLLVMSLEHRYYGESFPFRPKPESADIPVEQLKWLTVEQVVEDAAYFLKTMRAQLSVPEAVPVITFGGSYGGALAAWLRAAKPDVFAAGISSSGPVNFIVGTPQWSKNSDLFHEVVSAAARAGGASCPSTIRAGLNEIERLGKSKAGRAELGERLKLCGRRDAVVNKVSAMELSDHFYTRVFGEIAQYDNVPFLYGSLATACKVATKAAEAAPSDALAPLLALTKWAGNLLYKSSDGSGDCWYWDIDSSDGSLIVDVRGYGLRYLDYSIYLYQSCTQGTPVTSLMSRKADADDMYTSKRVAKSAIKRDCLKIYDKSVATIKPAPFMAKGPKLLRRVGGVVFTNGEFDPWAGGSPRSLADLKPDAKAEAGFEYVSYPGVSHVHDLIWYDPFDAPANKGLRQKALDAAATFAEAWRQARL